MPQPERVVGGAVFSCRPEAEGWPRLQSSSVGTTCLYWTKSCKLQASSTLMIQTGGFSFHHGELWGHSTPTAPCFLFLFVHSLLQVPVLADLWLQSLRELWSEAAVPAPRLCPWQHRLPCSCQDTCEAQGSCVQRRWCWRLLAPLRAT